MSANNGVIRIGRKGTKLFAFGEAEAFSVDVVTVFQNWIIVDDSFRPVEPDENGDRRIPVADMPAYHQAAVEFVKTTASPHADDVTVAEALDFIARLREQYDELAAFFRPKLRDEHESPVSSEAEVRFSEETPTQS